MLALGQDTLTPCVMCNTQHAVVWHVGRAPQSRLQQQTIYTCGSKFKASTPHTRGHRAPLGASCPSSLTHTALWPRHRPPPTPGQKVICVHKLVTVRVQSVRQESQHTDEGSIQQPCQRTAGCMCSQAAKSVIERHCGCKLAASPGVQGSLRQPSGGSRRLHQPITWPSPALARPWPVLPVTPSLRP